MGNLLVSSVFLMFLFNGCHLFNSGDQKFSQIEERLAVLEKALLSNQVVEQEKPFDFPVGESYLLGNKDAKISIVIFTNLQCGYCARTDKALHEALRDPELKNNVNLVVKHYPFLSRSKPATKAAFAAGEQGAEKFWLMSEKIYANQGALTDENFIKWAKQLGLDINKFSADLLNNDKKYDDILAKDLELVKMAKINSTPSIFVGGFSYEDEPTASAIKAFIKKKNLL